MDGSRGNATAATAQPSEHLAARACALFLPDLLFADARHFDESPLLITSSALPNIKHTTPDCSLHDVKPPVLCRHESYEIGL